MSEQWSDASRPGSAEQSWPRHPLAVPDPAPPPSGPPSPSPYPHSAAGPAYQQGLSAPGPYPPGAYPPGTYPPSVYPPSAYPPGAYPPGLGSQPPGGQGAYPPGPGAYPPGPQGYPRPQARRPEEQLARPVAYDVVPGTPFGLALVPVPPTSSGPAAASTVTGIGSILVSLVVGCFAALGAEAGWGPTVAGAFAVLAVFAGSAALVLGRVALRQISRGAGEVRGRGLAIAGLSCGGVGLLLTAGAFGLSLVALT